MGRSVIFGSVPKANFWRVFSSPEPKARVSYCHSAPSVVRPSVVVRRRPSSSVRKLFTFSTSSPKPLDGFWWNLVGMKYSCSLTSVVVFRPDPSRGGSRAGAKIGHGGPLLQETSSSDRKATATNQMDSNDSRSMWEEVLLSLVPFRSQIFDAFWRLFGLRHFALILMQFL